MDTTLLMQIFILINAVVLGAVVTLAIQYARAHRANKPAPQVAPPVESVVFDPAVKRQILQEAETNFRRVVSSSVTSLENDLINTTAKLRTQLEKFGHDAENEEAARYHKTIEELHNEAKTILGAAQTAITGHQTDLTAKLTERQEALEEQLIEKITGLEQELVKRQAELQAELNERQAELEARLAKHHAELRTNFVERQAKVEAELHRHQTELEAALKEREVSLAKIQSSLDSDLTKRRAELEDQLTAEIAAKQAFLAKQLDTKLSDAVTSFLLEALQHNVDLGAQAPYLTALLDEHKAELLSKVEGTP